MVTQIVSNRYYKGQNMLKAQSENTDYPNHNRLLRIAYFF